LEVLYRYLVDDFMFNYVQGLKPNDFTTKTVGASKSRKGKREHLNDEETRRMKKEPEKYFGSKGKIPLIRHWKKQRLETLINEESLLQAKHLRDEVTNWTPRMAMV
jgi:hypothetical protein